MTTTDSQEELKAWVTEQLNQQRIYVENYVKTYIRAYVGEDMQPATMQTSISGYIPLHISEVIPHINQTNINGHRFKQWLIATDQLCRQHNINPYVVVAWYLLEINFGNNVPNGLLSTTVHQFMNKSTISELDNAEKVIKVVNILRKTGV